MSTGDAGELASVPVATLPSTGTDVPGLWVVATKAGTRYVIAVPPEGPARAVRLASYGYDRGRWRPYLGSQSAHLRGNVPIRIGSPALVRFTEIEGDWYLSTTVTSIEEYTLSGLLDMEGVEGFAETAMRSHTVTLVTEAVQAGRIRDEHDLAKLCADVRVSMSDVLKRLGPDGWQVTSQSEGWSPTQSAPPMNRERWTEQQPGHESGRPA